MTRNATDLHWANEPVKSLVLRMSGAGTAFLVACLVGCGSSSATPNGAAGAAGTNGTSQAGSGGVTGGGSGGASGGSTSAGATSTGGTAANGGSAGAPGGSGTAGAAPVSLTPPVDCSKLATKVGVWENISPPALLTPPNVEVYSVAVSPLDGTVFVSGGNNTNGAACPQGTTCPQTLTGVLRSSDCGASFSRINSVAPGTDSANLITGALWAMLLDPKNPNIMYVANGYGMNPTLYKSTNAGVDFTALKPDPNGKLNFVQAVAVSPYDSQHLAITWHVTCEAPRKPFCLSKSNDGGATWTLFDGPSSIPNWMINGWMEASSISILGPTSYIVITPAGVWYTGDTGTTWAQVAPEIVYATYSGSSVIAGGDLFMAGAGHILKSPAAPGKDPPFDLGTSGKVTPIEGSPTVTALVSDGENLYVGSSRDGEHQLWSASLADTSTWHPATESICTGKVCRGPNEMAYDPVHHVVYAANWAAGLWRYVTK
jgi:hypothetical protein